MLKGEKREEEIVQNLINADIFRVEFEKYQCIAMMKDLMLQDVMMVDVILLMIHGRVQCQ